MLTESQNKIIESLKGEFEKMNTSKNENSTNIIDVQSVLNQHKENQKRKSEIELNNERFKSMQSEIINKWCKKLNESLKDLGLQAKEGLGRIVITALNSHVCYTKELIIDVIIKTESERVGANNMHIGKEIRYSFDSTVHDSMDSILNFTNSKGEKIFQKKITELFNYINK